MDDFLAPSVAGVAPVIQRSLNVTFGGEQTSAQVSGVTPISFPSAILSWRKATQITHEQVLGQASVAFIGTQVADKLFGRHDGLVGETIRIEGQPFRIIGVLESKGGGSFGSQDNVVADPLLHRPGPPDPPSK